MNGCECMCSRDDAYAFDAAGQKVYAGDYVMATLPNVPATRKLRPLHPCRVVSLKETDFHLLYAGKDKMLQRWAREVFLRWRNEVVKVDASLFNIADDDGSEQCRTCCRRRIECDLVN